MTKQIPYDERFPDPKKKRDPNDFYVTPECATLDLLARESFILDVWEVACGNLAISNVLKNEKYRVFSSDVVNRGYEDEVLDFLQVPNNIYPFKKTPGCNRLFDIITNPPFKYAKQFVEKALALKYSNRVAMFVYLSFLSSQKRKQMFESTPLEKVYIFSYRVPVWIRGEVRKGGKNRDFAWCIWNKNYRGQPCLYWI